MRRSNSLEFKHSKTPINLFFNHLYGELNFRTNRNNTPTSIYPNDPISTAIFDGNIAVNNKERLQTEIPDKQYEKKIVQKDP